MIIYDYQSQIVKTGDRWCRRFFESHCGASSGSKELIRVATAITNMTSTSRGMIISIRVISCRCSGFMPADSFVNSNIRAIMFQEIVLESGFLCVSITLSSSVRNVMAFVIFGMGLRFDLPSRYTEAAGRVNPVPTPLYIYVFASNPPHMVLLIL